MRRSSKRKREFLLTTDTLGRGPSRPPATTGAEQGKPNAADLAATPPASDGRRLLVEIAVAAAAVEEWRLLGWWGRGLRWLGRVEHHRIGHRRHNGGACRTMLVLLAIVTRCKAAVESALTRQSTAADRDSGSKLSVPAKLITSLTCAAYGLKIHDKVHVVSCQ